MVKNNIGVIILVSAIVAVVTAIVTGLIVANVNLSPQKTISDAGGSIINAHKCMADGTCEVNAVSGNLGVFGNLETDDLDVNDDLQLGENAIECEVFNVINNAEDTCSSNGYSVC